MSGSNKPIAFLSYSIDDDIIENGRITRIREMLSAYVKIQTGKEFPIFQDRKDIQWGQLWKERIDNSIEEVTFLIPVITPGFFESKYCRDELKRFLETQKNAIRYNLVFPILYIETPLISEPDESENGKLAEALAAFQFIDLTKFWFTDLTDQEVRKTIANMAKSIIGTMKRIEREKEPVTPVPIKNIPEKNDFKEPVNPPPKNNISEKKEVKETKDVRQKTKGTDNNEVKEIDNPLSKASDSEHKRRYAESAYSDARATTGTGARTIDKNKSSDNDKLWKKSGPLQVKGLSALFWVIGVIVVILIIAIIIKSNLGPSAEEKARAEKRLADSTMMADSMAAAYHMRLVADSAKRAVEASRDSAKK